MAKCNQLALLSFKGLTVCRGALFSYSLAYLAAPLPRERGAYVCAYLFSLVLHATGQLLMLSIGFLRRVYAGRMKTIT